MSLPRRGRDVQSRVMILLLLASGMLAQVTRLDPALDALIPADAKVEKLGGGLKFTEGPVWLRDGSLLFSDVRDNAIFRWTEKEGVKEFLRPSGYTGTTPGITGSNGLTLDRRGRLHIAEHGDRRITRFEKGAKTVVVDRFEGKRFSSPNDLVFRRDGSLYFTDPPYGLPKQDEDPGKEIAFNGVYRLKGGQVTVLVKDLTRPNGLAFSPDEKALYVANSDAKRKLWMRYDVAPDGTLANGRVLLDVTAETAEGLPDGLKVDRQGNVWATGPGGVWIISPAGKVLGKIVAPEVPANVGWGGADGKTLFLTARTGLYRIRTTVGGLKP